MLYKGPFILLCLIFSVDRPRKFELLSLCASKGGQKPWVTTFESNFVGQSTENIRQSKIKAPLKVLPCSLLCKQQLVLNQEFQIRYYET